jgi:hypothetical protein
VHPTPTCLAGEGRGVGGGDGSRTDHPARVLPAHLLAVAHVDNVVPLLDPARVDPHVRQLAVPARRLVAVGRVGDAGRVRQLPWQACMRSARAMLRRGGLGLIGKLIGNHVAALPRVSAAARGHRVRLFRQRPPARARPTWSARHASGVRLHKCAFASRVQGTGGGGRSKKMRRHRASRVQGAGGATEAS